MLNNFTFIKADPIAEKTKSGILLGSEDQLEPCTGMVLEGTHKGKHVYFKSYKFEDIELVGGETVKVGKEEDIIALV